MKLLDSTADFRKRRGASLTECLVAIAVVSVMAVSLFAGMTSGLLVVKTTREDLRATEILAQKMEAVRLCTWSQLSNCPTAFQEYYSPVDLTNNTAGVLYGGTISIGKATNVPDANSYQSKMRLITVSVGWTNYNGNQPLVHRRSMQTQAAYLGMQNYIWGARP